MKPSFLLLLLTFFVFSLNAQQYQQYPEQFRDFTLKSKVHKVQNSLYDKIKIIDLRKDTLRLGQGQFGLLNKKLTLTPKPSLSVQLSGIVNQAVDGNSKKGELALCIRNFKFSERTAANSEEGFCAFTADLYRKSDSVYFLLQSIDTLIRVKSMDVTKQMIHEGDSLITRFVNRNMLNPGVTNIPLKLYEIVYADSIAKRQIKLFNTPVFTDGIYNSYNSFKNQVPDQQAIVIRKNNKIKTVKITNEDGVVQIIKPQSIYAIVTDGIPYIATEFGYYPLNHIDDNFAFIGKFRGPANSDGVFVASMAFGLVGGLVASQIDSKAYFYCELNYKNGEFIRLRRVPGGVDESIGTGND